MYSFLTFLTQTTDLAQLLETYGVPTIIASSIGTISMTGAIWFFNRRQKNAINLSVSKVMSLATTLTKTDSNANLILKKAEEINTVSLQVFEMGKQMLDEAKQMQAELREEKAKLSVITNAIYLSFNKQETEV